MTTTLRPLMLRAALAASLACALASPAAYAQAVADTASADSARHGKHSSSRTPELALQANASKEVTQDTINIVLEVQVEAAQQAAAGQQLTTALDALVKRAKGNNAIELRTGNYRVYQVTDDKGKSTGWRGRGELRLESHDFAAASALASKLSDASAISNLRFSLSRQAREAEEKRLLTDAAKAFQARALAAANAFGFTGYRMGKLTLGGTGGVSQDRAAPYMMASMSRKGDAAVADIPLEPDTELVTVDVNGTIFLQ